MVQTQNKFFDDLAKLATGAAGTLHGVKAEFEGAVRQRVERLLSDMDLVTREEFEAIKAMAVEARRENEDLKARLDALEGIGQTVVDNPGPAAPQYTMEQPGTDQG